MRNGIDPAPVHPGEFSNTDCCATCTKTPQESCLVREVRLHPELVNNEFMLPSRWPLYSTGDEAHSVFIVCSGYLKLVATDVRGQRMVVQIAGPCSLLGLNAALFQGTHELSAESLTDARLRSMDRGVLSDLMDRHHSIRRCVMAAVYRESHMLLEDVRRIGLSQTVACRLGSLLVDLSRQIGVDGEGNGSFPLVLSYSELASMVGTTRESASRAIGEFVKRGWISIDHQHVTILDPELRLATDLGPAVAINFGPPGAVR